MFRPFLEASPINCCCRQTPPYNMLKEDSKRLSGNDRFEGFGIELIDELSHQLGFNYTFVVQEDGEYGTCDQQTGACSGMIAEVVAAVRGEKRPPTLGVEPAALTSPSKVCFVFRSAQI